MAQYQSPINALLSQLPQFAMQMYQSSKEDKYRDKELQYQKDNARFSQGIQNRNTKLAEQNALKEAVYRQAILKNAGDEASKTAEYRQNVLDQDNAKQDRITNRDDALGLYNTIRTNFDSSVAPNVDFYNQETGEFNPELNTMSLSRSDYTSQFKDYAGEDWESISGVAGEMLPNDYGAYSAGYGSDLVRSANKEYTNEYKDLIKDPEKYKQLMSLAFGANLAETGYQMAPYMFTPPGEFPMDTPMGDLLSGAFKNIGKQYNPDSSYDENIRGQIINPVTGDTVSESILDTLRNYGYNSAVEQYNQGARKIDNQEYDYYKNIFGF